MTVEMKNTMFVFQKQDNFKALGYFVCINGEYDQQLSEKVMHKANKALRMKAPARHFYESVEEYEKVVDEALKVDLCLIQPEFICSDLNPIKLLVPENKALDKLAEATNIGFPDELFGNVECASGLKLDPMDYETSRSLADFKEIKAGLEALKEFGVDTSDFWIFWF